MKTDKPHTTEMNNQQSNTDEKNTENKPAVPENTTQNNKPVGWCNPARKPRNRTGWGR